MRKEGWFLKFHRLAATFGRLNNKTLELGPGLNILEAPNETGKSTWCAFILAMLYGIDSRQRDKTGFIAEKNRYAPWSGTAMSGRLDCSTGDTQLTLLRETKRPNAPLGHFTAQYTDTANPVPGLNGQNCGEELLGIPREVYERSAFIRQAGLGISANAELERRIVSLITAGDEGTSYSEASSALKKQLNRRRHNKTGELPAAEAKLAEIRRQLDALQLQRRDLMQARQAQEALLEQQDHLRAQLDASRRYDDIQKYQALSDARAKAAAAQQHAEEIRKQLEADHIPENDVIARLRGAIVNLETVRKSVEKARDVRDDALKARLHAEAAAGESPFAGMTPAQAERLPLDLSTKPRFPLWAASLLALLGGVFGFSIFAASQNLLAAIGGGCGLFGFVILLVGLSYGKKQALWEAQAAELREQRDCDLKTYEALYQTLTTAQAQADKASTAFDTLYNSLSSNEQGILLEVRRFAPAAFDISAADAALRECAVRRKALAEATADAQREQLHSDVMAQQLPDIAPPSTAELTASAPAHSQTQLESMLADVQRQLTAHTSAADRLSGQISAAGDPDALTARAEELENTIRSLSCEYDAIALAMSILDSANTTLQSRFSPALGRRTADIFAALTDNRYAGVVLDRSFRMAAEPAGDTVYRDAQLLSAGAADQLYLAARLAICEMVLPEKHCPPIVLDDALSNYDDARCAAALKWLRKEAEHRQILLFTCHSREAEFFRDDPQVTIQRLTDAPPQV